MPARIFMRWNMYYDYKKVIATAESWVGYLEKKNGDLNYLPLKKANAGSANYTWFNYNMHKIEPAVMDYPAAWCDAFVDYCFTEAYGEEAAKYLLCGAFNDYTPASSNLYKNAGRWYTEPRAGDQIFFRNSERICHTGIVYKVADNRVYTIEGNTSGGDEVIPNGGGVCRKSYPLYYERIAGYGRPRYGIQEAYMFTAKTIREGDRGAEVYLMQRLLRAEGYKMKNGKPLGLSKLFGEQTLYALKAYQRDKMLEVDGICGPITWASLINLPSS